LGPFNKLTSTTAFSPSAVHWSLRSTCPRSEYFNNRINNSVHSGKHENIEKSGTSITLVVFAKSLNREDKEEAIDAVVIGEEEENKKEEEEPSQLSIDEKTRKRDVLKDIFQSLTSLSLQDYKWRSSVFKQNEAERKMEESVARMMGESPSYVRPMDASDETIGPLGKAEKNLVEWLTRVIEEEANRAQKILEYDGKLVRPIDMESEGYGEGGPLAELENKAVKFLKLIAESETERAATGTMRPMQLEEAKRGPLGKAESKLVSALEEIKAAEKLRMEQSRNRGGEVVRPIDVPGPLGEVEKAVLAIVTAEKKRAKEGEIYKKIIRPKDSSVTGPLGNVERDVSIAVERVREEERERLRNIQRFLEDNRPMEKDRESPLGFSEAFVVGLLRAPKMMSRVVDRVKELVKSEPLKGDGRKMEKSLSPGKEDSDTIK